MSMRTLRGAEVKAVTATRVLLTRKVGGDPTTTWWWNYRRDDSLRQISNLPALSADVAHDRMALNEQGDDYDSCVKVTTLFAPRRTLWRICGTAAHAWSPDGSRALATHT